MGQNTDRKPQAVGREIASGHLLHPEPDLQLLDQVLDLTPAVVEPDDFFC